MFRENKTIEAMWDAATAVVLKSVSALLLFFMLSIFIVTVGEIYLSILLFLIIILIAKTVML